MNKPYVSADPADSLAIDYAGEAARCSLTEILQRVDREVSNLGALAERVQEVLSPLIVEGCTSDRLEQSQGLDLLTQSLYGLSAFLSTLAPEMAPHWKVSPVYAAQAVTLSALSRRLSGVGEGAEPLDRAGDASAGDCDLF